MSWKRRCTPVVALIFLASSVPTPAWPYSAETHRAINDGAAVRSSLNGYLVAVLGFPEGLTTTFNGRDVVEWIREGGVFEDQPVTRTANHFHYPLREWDHALLTDLPGSLVATQSSVLWAQNPNQTLGGTWSWIRARREFLDALTMGSVTEREVAFGNSFRALGQVLHLVADASVPAHVRNDSHITGEPFETWVETQARPRGVENPDQARGRFLATFAPTSVAFSATILGTEPNPLAPIPIAKVFDADAYDGTAETLGLTGGKAVGITEVSNANFFSGSTIFADRFGVTHQRYSPFPASTAVEHFIDPNTDRRYWRKTSPGVAVQHLATVSRLEFFRELLGGGPPAAGGLDPVVHGEYARQLIPRAVGYSAGLLDYFFRGRLQPSFVAGPNGGREVILQTQIFLPNEAIGPGTLRLLYDDENGVRRLIHEKRVDPVANVGVGTILPAIQFDIPAEPPLQYVVVYRGRLGLEADAVVGRVFGGLPIVAVQELATLTGEEFDPTLFDDVRRPCCTFVRQKDPNHQRAAGSFWAGGSAGVSKKIREVRLEEASGHDGLSPPKAALRLNGKEVGTHWRATDDPGLLPEQWEVVLSPIPGETSEFTVVPPPAIWVNDFRTALLWIESAISTIDQRSLPDLRDGLRFWVTEKRQRTNFHFGDGFRGLDPFSLFPLTAPRTRVSFRPVGEVAGLAVPQAEVEVSPESCSVYRIRFIFGWRQTNVGFGGCEVGSEAFWAKNLLQLDERMQTVGEQPDPAVPPLLTSTTFRREFLDVDLQRFLGVGVAPPKYEIQTQ